MSILRNITLTLAITAAGVAAACSDAPNSSPLAPTARPAAGAPAQNLLGGLEGTLGTITKTVLSTSDSLRAARRLSITQFDLLKAVWPLYQRVVEPGNLLATAVRCEPTTAQAVTKTIGPSGGRIDVGPHSIAIPAGALASNVEITASRPGGTALELDFAPQGLKFAKPVELTFDYKGCAVPLLAPLDVVYVGSGWHILETIPSLNLSADTKIKALTDHFSGYLVAWGRTQE